MKLPDVIAELRNLNEPIPRPQRLATEADWIQDVWIEEEEGDE